MGNKSFKHTQILNQKEKKTSKVHLQLVLGTKSSRFLFPSQNPPSSRTLTPLQHKQRLENFAQNKSHCFQSTRQNNVMWMWTSSLSITPSFIHHLQCPNFFQIWNENLMQICATYLLTYLPYVSHLPNLLVWTFSHNMQLFLMQVKNPRTNPVPHPPTSSLPPKTQSEVPYVFFIGEISPKTEIQKFKN